MENSSPSFLPASTATTTPPQSPSQIVTQNASPAPTKIAVTSDLDRRLRWHIAAWWVLFILLLVSWFGFGALVLTETGAVREDSQQSANHLDDRINQGSAASQSRIDNRAASLDARVDQVMRDNALLRSELSAMEMRVAQQESTCRQGCSIEK